MLITIVHINSVGGGREEARDKKVFAHRQEELIR